MLSSERITKFLQLVGEMEKLKSEIEKELMVVKRIEVPKTGQYWKERYDNDEEYREKIKARARERYYTKLYEKSKNSKSGDDSGENKA